MAPAVSGEPRFFFSPFLLRSFIAASFLIKPDKRRELNLRRPRLSRLLSPHPASCICFVLFFLFFRFSAVALIFEHESHHPDTQEKERDHRPAARRRLIARKLACVLSISGIDVLIHLACRHWRRCGSGRKKQQQDFLQEDKRHIEEGEKKRREFFLFVCPAYCGDNPWTNREEHDKLCFILKENLPSEMFCWTHSSELPV